MPETYYSPSMESWLADVRNHVQRCAPDMLHTLDVYECEARFGRRYIADDLSRLVTGSAVLEVGAGSLLLSCQLVREGFKVSALEPVGDGFFHFDRLRRLVLERADALECQPEKLNLRAEELSIKDRFDFAFSINVMEHVADVKLVIENIMSSLHPAAVYRFTCPNYLFPYEPHFNIPIFFTKKITEKFLLNKIYTREGIDDQAGLWRSLNWISVTEIKKITANLPRLETKFNRLFLVATLERITTDREFALRRSVWMRMFIMALIKLRLHHLAGLIPAELQPIIDITLTKRKD